MGEHFCFQMEIVVHIFDIDLMQDDVEKNFFCYFHILLEGWGSVHSDIDSILRVLILLDQFISCILEHVKLLRRSYDVVLELAHLEYAYYYSCLPYLELWCLMLLICFSFGWLSCDELMHLWIWIRSIFWWCMEIVCFLLSLKKICKLHMIFWFERLTCFYWLSIVALSICGESVLTLMKPRRWWVYVLLMMLYC